MMWKGLCTPFTNQCYLPKMFSERMIYTYNEKVGVWVYSIIELPPLSLSIIIHRIGSRLLHFQVEEECVSFFGSSTIIHRAPCTMQLWHRDCM